jgi:Hemerythrin HHE cation binding domain
MTMNTTPRFDLYAGIHKTLRLAMTDTLSRFGCLDATDAGQRGEAIAQLNALLEMCRSHVDKENHHVHPAIEARRPGTCTRIANEHVEHLAAIDALEAELVAFQCAPDTAAAFALYRHLACFVAENLEHMEFEETVHNAALWGAYSDDELMQIHHAIVTSIEPAAMGQVMHWMLPAVNHDERVELLMGLRATAPAPAFEGAMHLARQRLAQRDWARLVRALEAQAMAA